VLTVATDSPAYPPYFEHNSPKNGEGLESAVAYAVAHKLGYARDKVKWAVERFDSSYAPGPKSFDFDINEISITPARAKVVTFSAPYHTNPQGILVKAGTPLAHATSLAAFKHAKLGVQIGTTSLAAVQAVIKPSEQPEVFNFLALALCYSAYVSEVFRAGIESVHPSQGAAALALGLTRTQALRHVIVPQAVRRVVPPLLNDFISLQKDVALVSIIGPQEKFRVAQIFSDANFNFTPLIAAALLYLCVTIPLTRFVDHLQIRSLRARRALLALGPH
jgi:ABC-type amino acid transport system permease subunit